MAMRMKVGFLAATTVAASVAWAEGPLMPREGDLVARRCQMINIGTAEKPRIVPDPGCSSRR